MVRGSFRPPRATLSQACREGNIGASCASRGVYWKGNKPRTVPTVVSLHRIVERPTTLPLHDKFGRAITDLRISITDRCNYKCVYCRTGNEGALYGDLPFADYLRMARVLVGMGVTKVRLTGGEPLLRNGIVDFVRELAKLRPQGLKPTSLSGGNGTAEAVPFPSASHQSVSHNGSSRGSFFENGEPLDIALTTNGHLLADLAQPLKDAGLTRVTVSMDAVDPDRFARITRVSNGYDHVLAGIRAARRAGLWPLKVNCVLMRGFNEDQIIPFGMFAREEGVTVRFIEFMPLEEDRTWTPNTVVTLDEILARMAEYRPLVEIPHARSETARRYRFEDGVGEIGIIAPVSHPFCGHCSRIRITSDGKIRTCLFSVWDHDLHAQMQRGASDDEPADFIQGVIAKKEERHHIGEPDFVPASRTMVHIGG
jgi:GTP 3',8-cyclase